MLHFVLCDDNIQILNRLEKTLESIFIRNNIDAEISYKSSTSEDFLTYISNNKVDAVILDINLKSAMSGCDIADIIRKKNKDIYIIFLTGHLEYALLAYKYKTFDYLPKPVSDERLEETILRLIDDMYVAPKKFIKINNTTIINEDDIDYIKKDGMKLVYCTASKNYETYNSFSKVQGCLPDNFVRCHKSYIININNIKHLSNNRNTIIFKQNSMCSVGAKYKNEFLEVLKNGNFSNNLECVNH